MAIRRVLRTLVFSLASLALTPTLVGVPLLAQARGPVQRIVTGKVLAKDGSPVKGAIVYLQDSRNSSIKSCIVDDDGSYRFVQLSQNTDYEIWARNDNKKGPSKTISSFDTKNELVINLKGAE